MKNGQHVSLDVFNAKKEKLCNIYDSWANVKGQAHGIVYRKEIGGFKSLSFNLPRVIENKRNFRWDFIRSEYLLRQTIGEKKDWYIVHAPKRTHDRKSISTSVTCNHLSLNLKTKNLYLTFDDTNGIGTIQYLLEQILKGTGWQLGTCDTFYERDGTTEKVRSLTSEGKVGAYQLISDVCNLFNAYPDYDGETKTVNIYAFNNKGDQLEMTMGKDIDAISVEYNSEDIITRLYVEGEYGENGYVSIDGVNPTGLSYLMNFDYYKEIGMFTDEHQVALDQYYEDMKVVNQKISEATTDILAIEDALNNLWGQIDYVIYCRKTNAYLESSSKNVTTSDGRLFTLIDTSDSLTEKIIGGEVTKDQLEIQSGDELVIINVDKTYRFVTVGTDGTFDYSDSDVFAIKFITLPAGLIGARQVSIEAKEKLIEQLRADAAKDNVTEEKKAGIEEQIATLEAEIEALYSGTTSADGVYAMMTEAVEYCLDIRDLVNIKEAALLRQEDIEAALFVSLGDMIKEGYWNNTNYTVGQEELLYADSVELLAEMSRPKVTYKVDWVSMAHKANKKPDEIDVNMKVRIYNPEIGVNDMVYISALDCCLDRRQDDSIELSNEDLRLSEVSFESILSRMTQLADLIEQKNSLFSRAEAIGKDGSIHIDRLEGTINILKNRLSSAVSSWYTDANGNIVFESTTGKSAMMLTGDGFMIAAGKTATGEWNWRTKPPLVLPTVMQKK